MRASTLSLGCDSIPNRCHQSIAGSIWRFPVRPKALLRLLDGVEDPLGFDNPLRLAAVGVTAWRPFFVDLSHAHRINLDCGPRGINRTRIPWPEAAVGLNDQFMDTGRPERSIRSPDRSERGWVCPPPPARLRTSRAEAAVRAALWSISSALAMRASKITKHQQCT